MNFLDGALFPENQEKVVITAAPYGPEWVPSDFPEDIAVSMDEQVQKAVRERARRADTSRSLVMGRTSQTDPFQPFASGGAIMPLLADVSLGRCFASPRRWRWRRRLSIAPWR
jgi:hypothetical protein